MSSGHLARVATFTALCAAVFVLDTQVPLGANVPLLYVVPMLIALWHAGERGLAAPAICTALTVVRVVWLPSGDWGLGVFNRALTILALWVTAILLQQFRRTQDQLQASEEAARFGEIAMGVAHELRNALGGIRAAVDVFGGRRSDSERDRAVKHELTNRVISLEHFVADLLMLSRPMASPVSPRPVRPLIQRAVASLRAEGHLDDIAVDVEPGDAVVPLAETVMEPALRQLLLNAAQAINGGGSIRVAIHNHGGVCDLSIQDTGTGIPPDLIQKIFDPFFTTKSRGRGLGLPIAKRAIEHHGGSLVIESRPGAGTTAIVSLPAARDHNERI